MQTVDCVVEEVAYRNELNGWSVLRVRSGREHIVAVGILPFVGEGERVLLTGEWGEHPTYGSRFAVSSFEAALPETKSEIERYLASGAVKGIGPATARLIVKKFGSDAIRMLDAEPERLLDIEGIGPKRARRIADSFKEQRDLREIMIFLQSHEIPLTLAARIFKRFGMAAADVIRSNPYLLVDEVYGVGFKTADKIARAAGIPPESEYRVQCGVRYVLTDAAQAMGHVYLPEAELLDRAVRALSVDHSLIRNALTNMIVGGRLVLDAGSPDRAIYLPSAYDAEREVADRLKALQRSARGSAAPLARARIDQYQSDEGIALCEEQRDAVAAAITEGVSIITGGPGTGKTTSIKCIVGLATLEGEVVLAAPTGRAAKRMSDATGCPAMTLHRLLEYGGEGSAFARNEERPLEAKMIVVDEMSMMDIHLMRSLLAAILPGTRLTMVGDADQLPSVGAGNVLRDLIEGGTIPVVRLNEIHRQAGESMIVVNAHRINRGEPPVMNGKATDFFIERKDSVEATVEAALDLATTRLPEYMGLDPMRDVQMLSPAKRGDAGVWSMNRLLQSRLNPPERGKPELVRGDATLRLGDKVMQIKNDYQIEWKRGAESGTGAFNGDIGWITAIDREDMELEVTFDDGRVARYEEGGAEALDLAYCLSVHKSQGCEFEAVVIPLFSGPPMLMTRNLLYTAITRAKRIVVIAGREGCVAQMIRNNRIVARYSALDRRLREAAAPPA